jgi:hypothetical protein
MKVVLLMKMKSGYQTKRYVGGILNSRCDYSTFGICPSNGALSNSVGLTGKRSG